MDVDFGELAHIISATTGGPRDVALDQASAHDRAHHSNLILLCANCHTIIDKAPASYPVEQLHEWKRLRIEELSVAAATRRFQTRHDARNHIEGLLDANRVIYRKYGPVGDPYTEGNPVLWRRYALATIVPNNRAILRTIEANRGLLTADERETLSAFRLHVDQFEARHVVDDFTVGTERFPEAMRTILIDQEGE